MNIELGDIVLRQPEERDAPLLYRYRNDREVVESLGGFSRGFSLAEVEDWIKRHRAAKNEVLWVIASGDTDECIGHVGIYDIDHRVRSGEFGILIGDKARWGKGIGRTATLAAMRYAFEELNLHRLHLTALRSNKKAIGLYERLGFQHEGLLREAQFRAGAYADVVIMSMLESEWRKR